MVAKRIGIVGDGHVGSALARGLTNAGHDVKPVGNDTAKLCETLAWAEIAFFAVPFTAIHSVVHTLRDALDGKILVDVTSAVNASMQWAVGFTTSGVEELQQKIPKASVVNAFNTVFSQYMETGHLGDEKLTGLLRQKI